MQITSSHSSASPGAPAATAIPSRACVRSTGWPLERVLFALAGTVTLLSAGLAAVISPWILLLTAFVGLNQLAYATIGVCGASFFLSRVVGLRSSLYTGDHEARR